jgi:hypothetical protein
LPYFLGIKSIEKRFKIAAQSWAEIGPLLQCQLGRPGPVAEAACTRAARVLTAHNPRAGRRGGTVTEGPMVVAGGKVLSASSRGPLGGHRARRELAGLNEVVAR